MGLDRCSDMGSRMGSRMGSVFRLYGTATFTVQLTRSINIAIGGIETNKDK